MPDDVILNKAEIIERCIERIRETYEKAPGALATDYSCQDVIVLNIERACQAAIDIGMRWIRLESLGVPKDSRDAFALLAAARRLPPDLADSLKKMVGFRNIAVHDYREIDFAIVKAIIERGFPDFRDLIRLGLRVGRPDLDAPRDQIGIVSFIQSTERRRHISRPSYGASHLMPKRQTTSTLFLSRRKATTYIATVVYRYYSSFPSS